MTPYDEALTLIRRYIKIRSGTMRKIAKELGVHEQSVSRVLTGRGKSERIFNALLKEAEKIKKQMDKNLEKLRQ